MTAKYEYSINEDFPNGKVNTTNLEFEIFKSEIQHALESINTIGDSITLVFKGEADNDDELIIDGGTTGPAGGLIAAHDNSTTIDDVTQVEVSNIPAVTVNTNSATLNTTLWKPDGHNNSRIYMFSVDLCKQETWYIDSVHITGEEIGVGNGIDAEFSFAHGSGIGEAIVDLSHGKITEENLIIPPNGDFGGYIPIVKVSGEILEEREYGEADGGAYEIDYIAGKLTFYDPPESGHSIISSYYYVPSTVGPVVLGGPPAGKKWVVNSAEVQFSADISMNDTFLQNVLVDVPIFDASGNYMFTAYDQMPYPNVAYNNVGNFLDFTYGSFPIIPAFGGPVRGLKQDIHIFRWEYAASIELLSSLNMRMKIWTKHNRGFGGERATITVYGIELDEN